MLYSCKFHQVESIFVFPCTAVAGCMEGDNVWILFESALLIKFGVACDQKTKSFAVKKQCILPMAASGMAVLEPGTFCFHDAEGRLWFTRIDEAPAGEIDESVADSKCETLKIRQTDISTVDSIKEEALSVNVLQHSEKQELLRDRNF